MKTKLPMLLIIPLLTVAGLVGCTNENDPNAIKVAIVSDSAESDTMNNFIKKYKAIPGNEHKKINVVKMGSSYDDYVFKSYLKNGPADIIQVYDYSCEYYANANLDGLGTSLLKPISSYMQRDGINESDFYESIIEMTKCKTDSNDMYWVPRDYNKVVCAFNKKIFDLVDIPYPTQNWTWNDLVSLCNQLNTQEVRNKVRQYSGSVNFFPIDLNLSFPAVYYPILKSFGVDLIDKDTRTCFGNTNEKVNAAKSAWNKLLTLADSKLAAPANGTQIPFTNKQAAMMFIVRPNLPTYVKSLGNDAIDFVPLPTYNDLGEGQTSYVGMGCTGYGITSACSDEKMEAAWDFLKFIISEQGQNAFSESGAGIPCLKALANDENAVFKQYLVTDTYHPNHEAFTAYPERDIGMNFMKGFEVGKQLAIDKYIKDNTLKNFADSSKRDAYFMTYKANMEAIWNS